jgi:carbon monoxide dehydrogenase subunit G
MAKAYASTVFDAPVEAVWARIRNFGALSTWLPGVEQSSIEGARDPDSVGCVRALHLTGGGFCTERLLALDDSRYTLTYAFVQPAFPVRDYVSTIELIPVTDGDRTFAQWTGTFEEAPEDAGKYQAMVSAEIYAAGLASLRDKIGTAAAGKTRWDGWRPAKVFCSSVINGPLDAVWARVRDFAGMAEWHPGITQMHMLGGVRADKVSGVREFMFGEGRLHERLTFLSDRDHAFRYTIEQSPMPWLNYHAGAHFRPITDSNCTFAVWTADWTASPNDDVALIPDIHQNVFQKAFDTLNERFFPGKG